MSDRLGDKSMMNDDSDDMQDEIPSREMLERRPSYRKILNDLSAGTGTSHSENLNKINEESENRDSDSQEQETLFQVMPISGEGSEGVQTLTMSNGTVQYPTSSTQFLIHNANSAYQLATATGQLLAGNPQHVLVTGNHVGEEASRKREVRLLKNREAAKECRRKKKEYVKCLENRVAVLENQNKALIDELKSLKELYCEKSDLGYA